MAQKFLTQVEIVDYEGESAISLGITLEALQALDLKSGEILEWSVDSDKNITIKRTQTVA